MGVPEQTVMKTLLFVAAFLAMTLVAPQNADAQAEPWYGYYGYRGNGGYGGGYSYGGYGGRNYGGNGGYYGGGYYGKRSADAEPAPEPYRYGPIPWYYGNYGYRPGYGNFGGGYAY